MGSAVNQTSRQVGGALGVAILVAILSTATTPSAALENFRHLWTYAAAMAVLAGATSGLLGGGGMIATDRAKSATELSPTASSP